MSRYRSTRPDPRSKLTAPFLLRIAEMAEKRADGQFPFTLPFMRRGGFALEFSHPVTILVGENGTGKSSLLEAIARKAGFNPRGGSRDNVYGGKSDEVGLADALHCSWLPKVTSGFFFRAESFFDFVSYVEGAHREDPFAPEQPWGARSLHERSHGEAFLSFFANRLGSHERCLYLLDEPESALSPERQLEFMAMLAEQRATGRVQYIIATHSVAGRGLAPPGQDPLAMPRIHETVPLARKLRLTPSDAEIRLWSRLRRRQLDGFRFRRQHPLGPYVVDFFCAATKLVIEVDGGQHAEDGATPYALDRGAGLSCGPFLEQRRACEHRKACCARFMERCAPTPHPDLPLKGGGAIIDVTLDVRPNHRPTGAFSSTVLPSGSLM
jgi:predicted ATPase